MSLSIHLRVAAGDVQCWLSLAASAFNLMQITLLVWSPVCELTADFLL